MPALQHLLARLVALGPVGLFFMGVVDSSSIPMPPELLLVPLALAHPASLLMLVVITTAGSTVGTLILFGLARKLGGTWVESKMPAASFRRARNAVQTYDLMAVAVPAMAPPPFPFKFFVLVAGMFEMSWTNFAATMSAGRFLRYFLEAWLVLRYGASGLTYIRQHPAGMLGWTALLLGLAYLWGWSRKRRTTISEAEAPEEA